MKSFLLMITKSFFSSVSLMLLAIEPTLAQSGLTGELNLQYFPDPSRSAAVNESSPPPIMSETVGEEAQSRGTHYVKHERYYYPTPVPERGAISGLCYTVVVPKGYVSDFSWLPAEYFQEQTDHELKAAVSAALVYEYLYAVGESGKRGTSNDIFIASLEEYGASDKTIAIAESKINSRRNLKYGSKAIYIFENGIITEKDRDRALRTEDCEPS